MLRESIFSGFSYSATHWT